MGFLKALQLLTILPVPHIRNYDAGDLDKPTTYFPIVGLLLGGIIAALNYAFLFILPTAVVNVLVIISLVILTGAHHLDGFIDTCDAMVTGKTRQERLAIMSDTRVGAFGIAGLSLLILLKYTALLEVSSASSLILMAVLGRWTMACSITIFPSAKTEGMGFAIKRQSGWIAFFIATFITLAMVLLMLGIIKGLLLCIVLLIFICGIAAFLSFRFGGLTGDNYGAINEIAEVLVLILLISVRNVSI